MPVNDELGTRMKVFYEQVPKTRLVRRMPVAIRIDGKAFHTFTRGFQKPFDEVLGNAMIRTMKYLCENIQGCKLGYTQSDEITLLHAGILDLLADDSVDGAMGFLGNTINTIKRCHNITPKTILFILYHIKKNKATFYDKKDRPHCADGGADRQSDTCHN